MAKINYEKINPEEDAKPDFLKRIKALMKDEKDYKNYLKSLTSPPPNFIRCNTIKISPENLLKRLKEKGWKIKQPFKKFPEIMIVENKLLPGELGRSLEHQLGYYYVQEVSSMLPILALNPDENDSLLDLCASPGSKTTQAAAKMNNKGLILANELKMGRIKILSSNLQRCGVSNTVITKKDGYYLCKNLKKQEMKFTKILVDAPCSGEGTLRTSFKTYKMWNSKTINALSKLQKALVASAIEILEKGGEMIYSTCTHAPEENEEIVNFILENFPELEIQDVKKQLPEEYKTREGITKWNPSKINLDKTSLGGRGFREKGEKEFNYNPKTKFAARIYPQDNDTEGFFIAKFKKIK